MQLAHPRACGENEHGMSFRCWGGGSSLRVRGKLGFLGIHSPSRGLIPARAGKTWLACSILLFEWAHPRACGENSQHPAFVYPRLGSSPRVRGKRRRPAHRQHRGGLIPARAGKTHSKPRRPNRAMAHPRACGENERLEARVAQRPGSSPRVRGKPQAGGVLGLGPRLIPARAGKTPAGPRKRPRRPAHPRACGENDHHRRAADPHLGLIPARAGKTHRRDLVQDDGGAHPRACGENHRLGASWAWGHGSSPRVRGKPQAGGVLGLGPRLIPARAGKTPCGHEFAPSFPAHPRACGENSDIARMLRLDAGSSPRVRGKLAVLGGQAHERGLIPARAGKTILLCRRGGRRGAHPRACGENALVRRRGAECRGSSPRVRGKQRQRLLNEPHPGLIPARAGKTRTRSRCRSFRTAHPRACGENAGTGRVGQGLGGSSPRVRGKRRCAGGTGPRRRLIPARAGKTTSPRRSRGHSTAHPRACGENFVRRLVGAWPTGSSPRVRGKRVCVGDAGAAVGLIPARAGKTAEPFLMYQ